MQQDLERVKSEIETIYMANPAEAKERIEMHLLQTWALYPPDQRLQLLASLRKSFKPSPNALQNNSTLIDEEFLQRFCRLLLGEDILQEGLSGEQIMIRLSEALNTLFDSVNELVRLINTTLLGRDKGEQTIRHIIGSRLQEETDMVSLQRYLQQIGAAFLSIHHAFGDTARTMTEKILEELDPAGLKEKERNGFSFGPLRKAENFARYEHIFANCKKWFDSGRFMEDFQREFEKKCRSLSLVQRR
jgi:hypothetical protein